MYAVDDCVNTTSHGRARPSRSVSSCASTRFGHSLSPVQLVPLMHGTQRADVSDATLRDLLLQAASLREGSKDRWLQQWSWRSRMSVNEHHECDVRITLTHR